MTNKYFTTLTPDSENYMLINNNQTICYKGEKSRVTVASSILANKINLCFSLKKMMIKCDQFYFMRLE
jgi:hypothetical protein